MWGRGEKIHLPPMGGGNPSGREGGAAWGVLVLQPWAEVVGAQLQWGEGGGTE